jgi:hypothetical protein
VSAAQTGTVWATGFTEFYLLTAVRALATVWRDPDAAGELTTAEYLRLNELMSELGELRDAVRARQDGGSK